MRVVILSSTVPCSVQKDLSFAFYGRPWGRMEASAHSGLPEEEGHIISMCAGGRAISEENITHSGTQGPVPAQVSKDSLDATHPFRAHSPGTDIRAGQKPGFDLGDLGFFPCGSEIVFSFFLAIVPSMGRRKRPELNR